MTGTTGTVGVRDATADDADAMGHVHVAAWRAVYRGMLSSAFLDALDPAVRGDAWRTAIDDDPTPTGWRRLVGTLDGEVVGIALVGPDSLDPDGPDGEVHLINVAPDAWGSGVATALFAECVQTLASLEYRDAVLWVASENLRARRFYEREGWHRDGGERMNEIGGSEIPTVRYRSSLSSPSAS
ncbi:MAG: GNAT family N-acetyltransferase [Actinomycetota bacterium]